ncbi:MAG: GTP cyclohydrolase I FolE [Acidobacteria bacterium]|nr:GTP cyclohydrolase I FolE [Acidobacteriota bacterium]NIM63976.1 GTP cyclohydrolase I FolE [Acidobacteriota bacterium]NIO59381.1 GTP cyclohydrolase I FolE [Acidobacteriota bacterium]NIQ30417.1 GTP cyclohydrolase I FolE [Acidobacteriota bacterium]NIQ85343.1 GTP cyclohydrolase I FolE [Acidobacteriota bacterium]
MDREKMAAAIRAFLSGIGPTDAEGLERTPDRVAQAWCDDLLSGYGTDPASILTWTAVAPGNGPVLVRQISFASICAHHLLPFFGLAHVAYLPDERLAGLSKIGRVVDAHARRLQTQERLTAAIANTVQEVLAPRGVLVILRAEHTCMSLRGVRKEQSEMVTVEARGVYLDEPARRADVLSLLRDGAG